jgi:hypothetical protein
VRVAEVTDRTVAALKEFHDTRPEDIGMPALRLWSALPGDISTKAYLALLRHPMTRRTIEWRRSRIELRSHPARFDAAGGVVRERCLARLLARGMHPFTARELACDLGIPETAVSGLLWHDGSRP